MDNIEEFMNSLMDLVKGQLGRLDLKSNTDREYLDQLVVKYCIDR